jgi:hypothetical protein
MEVAIMCSKCGKSYRANTITVKIYGPVIYTECPFCGNTVKKNLSSFLDEQNKDKVRNRFELISNCIVAARSLEKLSVY